MQEPVNEELFLNVREVGLPKSIPSLVNLWQQMLPDQLTQWSITRNTRNVSTLQAQLTELTQMAQHFLWYGEVSCYNLPKLNFRTSRRSSTE
jgi:hypothetical protein